MEQNVNTPKIQNMATGSGPGTQKQDENTPSTNTPNGGGEWTVPGQDTMPGVEIPDRNTTGTGDQPSDSNQRRWL